MKSPDDCRNIDEVREAIDKIDYEIVGLLGKRFGYVKEVVKYKARDVNSIIANERKEAVIKTRRELAENNGLNPDIIENIYRILIDYFIKEELELINKREIN